MTRYLWTLAEELFDFAFAVFFALAGASMCVVAIGVPIALVLYAARLCARRHRKGPRALA